MRNSYRLAALTLALLGACGEVSKTKDAAVDDAPADAQVIDAPADDAPVIDAPMATGTIREPMSASGRVTGGGMVLDVQFGHPIQQNPTTGNSRTFEGGAAIKP